MLGVTLYVFGKAITFTVEVCDQEQAAYVVDDRGDVDTCSDQTGAVLPMGFCKPLYGAVSPGLVLSTGGGLYGA